jgi:alkylglycerol monooxygenase
MESYVQVLNFGIPLFLLLIAIEWLVSRYKGIGVANSMDTISSLSSGITNVIKDVLGLTVVIVSYGWMVEHLAIFNIQSTLSLYVLAFIGKDFAGYWGHRFEHTINLLWNRHIIHHSSEEYNLSCALRQNISVVFSIFFFLYIPLAILGVPQKVIAVVAPLHLFAQFWYHTRLIGKMGWLEKIIVTPSHHRVHHSINVEYMDKNFAQIFIVWDKLFGTFQEELESVPPVYGVTRPVETWNPILINLQHFWLLVRDAWRARSWWDKIRIWFMPTGWRPSDVQQEFPVFALMDVHLQKKYQPPSSTLLQAWSWFQLIFHFMLMMYAFNRIAEFSFTNSVLHGGFIVLSVFAYTTLMDRSRWAIWAEGVKLLVATVLLYSLDGWFFIDDFINGGSLLMAGYFLLSFLMSFLFSKEARSLSLQQ